MTTLLPRRPTAQARIFIALLATVLFVARPAQSAYAEPADVDASPNVVVDANGQPPEDALGNLAALYDFTIERTGQRSEKDVVTGHFEGPLADVIARVLLNENHMIRHDSGKPGRIAKIVLLGQPSQTPASGAAPALQNPASPSPLPIPVPAIAPEPMQTATPVVQKAKPPAAASRPLATAQQKHAARTPLRSRRVYRASNN